MMQQVTTFGVDQLNRPTPQWLKIVFRTILYLSMIWAFVSGQIPGLSETLRAQINEWLLIGNGLINITIKFFGFKNIDENGNEIAPITKDDNSAILNQPKQ